MLSRREFLAGAGALASGIAAAQTAEPIIDIHQHTHYSGRSDEELIRHQRAMGVAKTVLLPAGSKYGLAADAWGNDSVVALARRLPKEDWTSIFDQIRFVRRSRRLAEGFEVEGAGLFVAPALFDEILLIQYLLSRSHKAGGRTFEGSTWKPLAVSLGVAALVGLAVEVWRRIERRRGKDILGDPL